MLKKYTCAIMALSTCIFAFGQETQLDFKVPKRVEHDLFGPVKSTTTVYEKELILSKSVVETSEKRIRTYDASGNLLTDTTMDEDGTVEEQTTRLYDEHGCLTNSMVIDFDEEATTTNWHPKVINVAAKEMVSTSSKTGKSSTTRYDEHGYEQMVIKCDTNGVVYEVVDIRRHPNHKEYLFQYSDGENKPLRTTEIMWTEQGLMREMHTRRYGTNEAVFITSYVYPRCDEQGNWTKQIKQTDLIKKGKKNPLSRHTATRAIEYHDQ